MAKRIAAAVVVAVVVVNPLPASGTPERIAKSAQGCLPSNFCVRTGDSVCDCDCYCDQRQMSQSKLN